MGKEFYELVCPFIKECRYADNKCCGFRVVECPHFREYEERVKEFIRELMNWARENVKPRRYHLGSGECLDLDGLTICKNEDGSWKILVSR